MAVARFEGTEFYVANSSIRVRDEPNEELVHTCAGKRDADAAPADRREARYDGLGVIQCACGIYHPGPHLDGR